MTPAERFSPRAVARAVLTVWVFRGAAALAMSYPASRTVGAFLPPGSPNGDALLFAPGGLHLVEAFRLGGRAIQASLEGSALVFVLASMAALLPLGIALAGLLHPEEATPSLARRAVAFLPALLALGGSAALLQSAGFAAMVAAVTALANALSSAMDERAADALVALFVVASCALLTVVGVLHDLARAVVVRHGARARDAGVSALDTLVRAPGAVTMGFLAPAAAGTLLVAASSIVTGVIDVSRPGAARVALVFTLHQATILALVVLRLSWLGKALRLVGPARDSQSDS